MTLPQDHAQASPLDDAEAQMRRALGLHGDGPRPRQDADRMDQPPRGGGGFTQGLHRRRFVQDGDVPVTVVRRDVLETSSPSAPTSSRLQRVEAALAGEAAARDRAERGLQDAQTQVQALQTKIGHNELAKNEALAAAKRDREELIALKQEVAARAAQIRELEARAEEAEDALGPLRDELAEERRTRKLAERLLRETDAEAGRVPAIVAIPARRAEIARPEPVRIPARRGRPPLVRAPVAPEDEPEPVKWWLLPAKTAGKRS